MQRSLDAANGMTHGQLCPAPPVSPGIILCASRLVFALGEFKRDAMMDFGIALPTKADSWRIARRAENLGFTHAWFYDTALLNAEIFVAMGAAAVSTSRIRLCTGVLTPSNRIAPVAASGLATLNALAPGRIIFGVGTGFTARRTLGHGPVTLKNMETYIRAIEALLRGEMISYEMEGISGKTRLMTLESEIINTRDSIPTHISAFGPKGRQLTAVLGAGWIGSMSTLRGERAALAGMQAEWVRQGRELSTLYSTLVGGGCVLNTGESAGSARARAQAGVCAAVLFHSLVEQGEFGEGLVDQSFPFREELDAYRAIYQSYQPEDARHLENHRGHMMFLRPEETHVTERVIRNITWTAESDELLDRLRGVKDAGYGQLAISLPPGQENDMMETWADVMAKV
jgi:5,10-methylenetetrahydromethanopterin reductase